MSLDDQFSSTHLQNLQHRSFSPISTGFVPNKKSFRLFTASSSNFSLPALASLKLLFVPNSLTTASINILLFQPPLLESVSRYSQGLKNFSDSLLTRTDFRCPIRCVILTNSWEQNAARPLMPHLPKRVQHMHNPMTRPRKDPP